MSRASLRIQRISSKAFAFFKRLIPTVLSSRRQGVWLYKTNAAQKRGVHCSCDNFFIFPPRGRRIHKGNVFAQVACSSVRRLSMFASQQGCPLIRRLSIFSVWTFFRLDFFSVWTVRLSARLWGNMHASEGGEQVLISEKVRSRILLWTDIPPDWKSSGPSNRHARRARVRGHPPPGQSTAPSAPLLPNSLLAASSASAISAICSWVSPARAPSYRSPVSS